jgi:hypothetical protein
MTVTPGESAGEEVGTSAATSPQKGGRHAVLIAYLSVLASLLTAIAGLVTALLR